MRKFVASFLFSVVSLGVLSGTALGSQCSDIYSGAQRGPPADWSWWGFGGACHVQWPVHSAEEEQRKSAQCHNTAGAYYIFFEGNKGTGRATCIFSFPDRPAAARLNSDTHESSTPRSNDKGDLLASPATPSNQKTNFDKILPVIPAKVDVPADGACPSTAPRNQGGSTKGCAALAKDQTDKGALAGDNAASKEGVKQRVTMLPAVAISQRRSTVSGKPPTDIQPAATNYKDPDPGRLTETLGCSSLTLGNTATCLSGPTRRADGSYIFTASPGCRSGLIAAVKTTDAKGRCIRKVVLFSPNHTRSEEIRSTTVPSILDAVPYGDQNAYACYLRRHNEVSCDGKINYSPKLAGDAGALPALPEPSGSKFIKRKKPNPTFIDSFFGKVKSLFQ